MVKEPAMSVFQYNIDKDWVENSGSLVSLLVDTNRD